jgi:hypothetical protein
MTSATVNILLQEVYFYRLIYLDNPNRQSFHDAEKQFQQLAAKILYLLNVIAGLRMFHDKNKKISEN